MRRSRPTARRPTAVAIAVAALLAVTASPAVADPARPTHYQSRVTGVEGAGGDLIGFDVLGGDAFLVLRVEPGASAEVFGYDGEPYVRVAADGTIEVNQRSPARWINDVRYEVGEVEIPPGVDAEAPPDWLVVADGGTYAWHDHRIHWMSPALPPQVDPSTDEVQPVYTWAIPMLVNGAEVVVHGELDWVPGPSLLVPAGLVLLWLAAGLALALRGPGRLKGTLLVAAAATLAVGISFNVGLPPGADGELSTLVLPVIAAALVGAGTLLARRDVASDRVVELPTLVTAAAGVPLLVWAVTQAGALTRPIVPGAIPTGVVRVVAALALAVGVVALVAAGRTALQATALDPPDEEG